VFLNGFQVAISIKGKAKENGNFQIYINVRRWLAVERYETNESILRSGIYDKFYIWNESVALWFIGIAKDIGH
jgi:hypothetical protein